ncbi:MAG: C-GCAxxG-C-C family protein [Methanomassiliicoccaceae archaeon]|nr:C-GCAxxG-C-C family protein [Methanomassiliicoccaceae archaeon]
MQVLGKVADALFITKEEAYRPGSCFGAGMLMGGACSAITGSFIAIGIKYGNYAPNDMDQKAIVNAKRMEFLKRFKEAYDGKVTCPELLKIDLMDPEKRKTAHDDGTIECACPNFIRTALKILKDLL